MKKRMILITAALAALVLLSGCCMSHQWREAGCEAPKTCEKCGKTEGEALGHDWKTACETPETCARCGQTRGEAPGHSWVDATCVEAKHCSVCGTEDGVALGHRIEAGKIVERLASAGDAGSGGSAYYHVGTCAVCAEEAEDLIGDNAYKLLLGNWTAVRVEVNGEPIEEQLFMELRENGTWLMYDNGYSCYGTWETGGCTWSSEKEPAEKEGDGQPCDLSFLLNQFNGNVEWAGQLDGQELDFMTIEALVGGRPVKYQFRRGVTADAEEFLADVTAKEVLLQETVPGKWEVRAYTDSSSNGARINSAAGSGIHGIETYDRDGSMTSVLSVQGKETTFSGTWKYMELWTIEGKEYLHILVEYLDENGQISSETRELTFWDEPLFEGMEDGGPVLAKMGPTPPSLWFNKVSG